MHELSLCEGILQTLESHARGQGYRRVKTVWLEIGGLAGVEQSALRFNFDIVTRDTLADGARLEIIDIPAQAWCLPCAEVVQISQRYDACPLCGSHQLQISTGEEMKIKELEVE
jgi:hydrogenase nickel incorporation protein HypA/HybF